MSTAGRINKSQTKFVPKRKNTSGSTSQRAASATPSVAGTPRVAAKEGLALPPTTEEDFALDGAGGEAGGSGANNETFLVPPAPVSKGPKSPAIAPKAIPTPIAPSSSFGPSDPTASSQASSTQSQSQAPSSLGLSFGPRDPSSSAPTTQYTSTQDEPRSTPAASFSPRRSPAKSKGTAFGVSLHGPQSSPPRASTSATPAPAPAPAAHAPLANLAAAASAAASADREGSASPPHRTQREIEEEAEVQRKAEKAEKARKKQENADATAKKKEERRLAKEAKAKNKKGKGKAVEGEDSQDDEEEEEESVALPKVKRKPKAKGKRKAVDEDEDEEEPQADELATPRDADDGEDEEFVPSPPKKKVKRKAAAAKPKPKSKKKKVAGEDDSESDGQVDAVTKRRRKANGVGRKKQTKADIEIFGRRKENGAGSDVDMEAPSGEEHGSDSDDSTNSKQKSARNHRKSVVEVEVDPATTTMAEIATGRDMVAGRTSERGRELAKKAMEARLARRLRAQKMKRHAARREEGLPSDSEPEEVDEEEEAALKKASEEGTPAPQGPVSASPSLRDSSPVVDPMAAVFGRTGSEEPMADEEEDDDDGKKADGEGQEDEDEQGGDDEGEGDEYGGLVESQYAPQMRIVDGQLVIDESSLVVDRALDANLGYVGPREVVHEAAQDRMVNSASWGKRKATEKWTADETEKFFDGVRQFGTDFEMIAGLFPNRTRRQIKSKWNKEDKINPAAITRALMTKKAINLEHYAAVTGQNLSGPVPDDPLEAVNKRRAEEEAIERANGGPDRYLPTNAKGKRSKKEGTVDARAMAKQMEEEQEEEEEDDGETPLEKLEREERAQEALDAEIAAELAKAGDA